MVVRYIVYVQNGETKSRALSETVTLEDTDKGGVVVTGITNPAINQKEGKELTCILYAASVIQQAKLNDINGFCNVPYLLYLSLEGDQLVTATVHLDHLSKADVLKLIRILEPYDKNLELKTAKDLKAGLVSNLEN